MSGTHSSRQVLARISYGSFWTSDRIPKEKIIELNIPTGVPLVYELDDTLQPRKSGYLEA